jgi:hydroxyacid-oxoacid transhydrogenase
MSCWHYYDAPAADGDRVFAVDLSRVAFGHGALDEVGLHAQAYGLRRVALFTDKRVRELPAFQRVWAALRRAGVDLGIYDSVAIEPSDRSMLEAAAFVRAGGFDGFVSVGGGSVIDTCKAAILYATYPADFLTYINAPIGAGVAVPGALPPHIACPTTSGTGSECTGIAICTLYQNGKSSQGGEGGRHGLKTGLVSRALRPTLALVDPSCSYTLPAEVVAASGCDVLCHALESYTARPYNQRPRPEQPSLRPMSQGANPYSDVGSLEALRLCGQYLLRAVRSSEDREARDGMMYAATLAGIAFGNAGVHLPHGMAYAVASNVRDYCMPAYPQEGPLVPHGLSVMLSAPAAFRFTASACPDRHLAAAAALGAEVRGADSAAAGMVLSTQLIAILRAANLPSGLGAVGYRDDDVDALCAGTEAQARLLRNAPLAVDRSALRRVFFDAMRYWTPAS